MGSLLTRGHSAAVAVVQRQIRRGRAPHALLLTGPDGCGKTTLALDLAAGLLCLAEDPAARPCRACAACHKVAHGNHPDLHRIAPEGAGEQIRLGQVQALISDLALVPMEARVRVCIIEDAQRLNPDAQNALLKALEEPVGETCIILAADDAAQLLPTVISRTARLRLGPVAPTVIADFLIERGLADDARARVVAAAAGGRPGLAVRLAADPESTLARGRMARQLLDLLHADRRARLAAASDLIATGVTLDAQLEAGEARPGAGSDPADRDDARMPLRSRRAPEAPAALAVRRRAPPPSGPASSCPPSAAAPCCASWTRGATLVATWPWRPAERATRCASWTCSRTLMLPASAWTGRPCCASWIASTAWPPPWRATPARNCRWTRCLLAWPHHAGAA